MSQAVKLRLGASVAFAGLVIAVGWLITSLLGFSSSGLPRVVAVAVIVSAGAWAFFINSMEAASPKQYAVSAVQYRPLLLSLGFFLALVVVWGISRAVVEWSIEPNIYDRGPCGRFNYDYCGTEDLNWERRSRATDLTDKIAAGIILLMPLSLAMSRVRRTFQ